MKNEVLGVKAPKADCTDKKCPFHGEISVKNEIYRGKVVKKDINRTATIEWFRSVYVPKYERYELRRSKMRVHNPSCLNAKIGQQVLVAKTRPLSKMKHHVIIQLLGEVDQLSLVKEAAEKLEKEKIMARKHKESAEDKEHRNVHKESKQ